MTDSADVAEAARNALLQGLEGMAERLPESRRLARCALLIDAPSGRVRNRVLQQQRRDGGWIDADETAWCCAYLAKDGGNAREVLHGLEWLRDERLPGGGWGSSRRDYLRIPVTGLVLRLVGDAAGDADDWGSIETLWSRDMSADVQLTYKGGFYLMATVRWSGSAGSAIQRTLAHLASAQNDDGGFGPWRNHPIGSDPWSTGICLVGMCSYPELADRVVIERAVEWLCRTQLPSGYWPYHFLDEGSAYAYWGLTEAIRLLERD